MVVTGCVNQGVRIQNYHWSDRDTLQVDLLLVMRDHPVGTEYKWTIDLESAENSDSISWVTEKAQEQMEITKTITQEEISFDICTTKKLSFHAYDCYKYYSNREIDTPCRPNATFSFSPSNPDTDEQVTFDASQSQVEFGNVDEFIWTFDTDNSTEKVGETVTHSFSENRIHDVELVVESDRGYQGSASNEVLVGSKLATGCNDAGVRINGYEWIDRETIQVYMWANMREFPEGTLWKWALDFNTATGSDSITWLTEKKSDDDYSTDMTRTVTQNDLLIDITEVDSIGFHMYDCTKWVSSREIERDIPSNLTADIEKSSGNISTGETVTFDGGNSDGDIDTYNWDFNDGTTDTGVRVQHTFDSSGEYDVSLTVNGPNGSDTMTASIVAVERDEVDFSFQPTNPSVGEQVTFEASGGTDHEWNFDDGTISTGQQTRHLFGSNGDYNVELTTSEGTHSKTVGVGTNDLRISNIERSSGGVPLEGISYEETFTAYVETGAEINRVDFQLENTTKSVTDKSGDWSATFDLGNISGTAILRVTATDTNGHQVTDEQRVTVRSIPEWIEWIVDHGQVTVTEDKARIDVRYTPFDLNSYEFDLGGIPIDAVPPNFDGAPKAGVAYDASQQSGLLDGEGGLNTELFDYGFNASLDMQGQIDQDLELLSADGTASVSLAIQVGPPLYIDLPNGIPCLDDRIGIETSVEPGLTLQGNFNGDYQFQDGTVSPSTALTVAAQLSICGAGAGAEVTGSLSGSFDIGTDSRNLSGTVGASGEAWFDVSVFTTTVTVDFEEQLGSQTESEGLTVNTTTEDVEWALQDKHGSQPATALPSVDASTTSTVQTTALEPTSTDGSGSYQRLTDRTLEDTQPDIATTDGDTIVVWSRQHPNKDVRDGRDIAYRRKSGGSWSGVSYLSDDQVSDEAPVVAATKSGALLVAWERVDTTITDQTGPADIHPHVEITYAIYDGSQWTTPTVLTDSSAREFQPTIAPDGDGWLLAWTSDPDPSTSARDVRYVRIASDGAAGSITRVSGATEPAAGSHPDSGGVLGYASLSNGSPSEVVSAKIEDGSQTGETRFTASDVTTVTAGHDRIVWQEGPTDDPVLKDGNRQTGTVTDLSFRNDVVAVAEPALATDGQDSVLAYRSYVNSTDSRKLVYRLDRGNGWIFDRQYVEPPNTGETVWQPTPALVADDKHFTTAFAITEQIKTGKNDVFVATHDFRAEYAIQASGPSGTTAGDIVTLTYTIKNAGDVDGTADVELTVSNGAGTAASHTLDPVQAGGTTSGTVDVTVDRTGEFTLSVGTSQTTQSTTTNTDSGFDSGSTTVTVATPDLSVADVRAGASDTVQITVENTGGATAFNIPLVVSDGTKNLTQTTITEVGVGSTQTVLVTIDPSNIDRRGEDRILLDPQQEKTNAVSQPARVTPTWLLQPDLVVTDEITYRQSLAGELHAEVLVGNESPVTADATLQAIRASDGTVVGESSVTVEGMSSGTAYEIVTIPLDGATVSSDTKLEVTVDSTVPDQDPSTTVVTDSYGPVFNTPTGLTEQWRHETSHSLQYSTPAVDTEAVYVGGLGSEFRALSRAQQATQELWSETRDGALSDSSPQLGSSLVFVGSGGGTLYAFDPRSSEQHVAWTYAFDSAITSSPAVLSGTVYVGANDGTVHAVSTDGSTVWSTPADVGGPVYSKVAAANGRVFVTTNPGAVVALDATDGSELWRVDTGTELGASGPAVANGTVYAGADQVYALDAANGNELWKDSSNYGGTAGSSPALANGVVYVGSSDEHLYALDATDGSPLWRFEADETIAAAPGVANSRIAVASLAGTVYLLDVEGTQLASQNIGEEIRAKPVIGDNDIVVGTGKGTTLKFSTGSGE